VPQTYQMYIGQGWGKTQSNTSKQNKRTNTHKQSLPSGLCGGNLLITQRCHQRSFSNQSFAKY